MTAKKQQPEPTVTDWSGLDPAKLEASYSSLDSGLKYLDEEAHDIVKSLGLEEHVLPRIAYAPGMYARDVYGFLSRRLRK